MIDAEIESHVKTLKLLVPRDQAHMIQVYQTYLKWIFCLSVKSLKSVSRWTLSPAAESSMSLRLFSQAQYAIYKPIVIMDST